MPGHHTLRYSGAGRRRDGQASGFACDVQNCASLERVLEQVTNAFGPLATLSTLPVATRYAPQRRARSSRRIDHNPSDELFLAQQGTAVRRLA